MIEYIEGEPEFRPIMIPVDNLKGFIEAVLMCMFPSHLNSIVVLVHDANEREAVLLSLPRSDIL